MFDFLREKSYRHALEYVQPDRAKCCAFFFSPPLGKSLNIFETNEGLSLVDTSFAPRDSPRPVIYVAVFHWSWGSL